MYPFDINLFHAAHVYISINDEFGIHLMYECRKIGGFDWSDW